MRFDTLALTSSAVASMVASASAACADFEILRRSSSSLRARAPTSEQDAANETLTDECKSYSFAPVTTLFNNVFAHVIQLTLASVIVIDICSKNWNRKATTEDQALFKALSSSIPNIAPRGTRAGDFTGVTYDIAADPACWWTDTLCTQPKIAALKADVTRCPEPETWGFTLDDGPNCSHNAFYDYLYEQKQKATLFYIGSNVVDWPYEAQRGLDDGHEICAHTWSHPYMTALTNEKVFSELYYSMKAIKSVIGVTVRCWRPPYGDVDDRVRYIAQALGLTTVIWSDNTFDYDISTLGAATIEANYNAILTEQSNGTFARQGTIVLTHELNNGTMSESKSFLPKIKSQFKAVVPIAVCYNNSQPYLETDYTYPNFAQFTAGTTSISLATATATSAPVLSIPLSTGQAGSLVVPLSYTIAHAANNAAATTTGSGSSATATSSASGSRTSATSTAKASAAQSLSSNDVGYIMGLLTLGAFVVGALLV
ncbi:BQ5605_C007g04615 [Microbotryum silenes-dioicae]|uniref:chitin deacetylase n=1 Tax=Microbotryum silenes-dioicae TaxID=796604 RepID=A0A2X0MBN4_9BASI|nr:BQ5605_C007g04615 [Microbotryum silenes-dioicae]